MKKGFPFIPSGQTVDSDPVQCYINRFSIQLLISLTHLLLRIWKPTLVVTGIDHIPSVSTAGNVLRPETKVKLSIRLPPTLRDKQAVESLKAVEIIFKCMT